MLRGEIRLTDLKPTRGSEADRRRPAIIVSNDRANATRLRIDSKAQAEQVRSVAVERLGAVLGRLPAHVRAEVDEAQQTADGDSDSDAASNLR